MVGGDPAGRRQDHLRLERQALVSEFARAPPGTRAVPCFTTGSLASARARCGAEAAVHVPILRANLFQSKLNRSHGFRGPLAAGHIGCLLVKVVAAGGAPVAADRRYGTQLSFPDRAGQNVLPDCAGAARSSKQRPSTARSPSPPTAGACRGRRAGSALSCSNYSASFAIKARPRPASRCTGSGTPSPSHCASWGMTSAP